jgi:hypothetical protein
MDATPGPSPQKRPRPALAPAGELVIQTGALKGTRRALGVPLTCIGRGPACDLRLDVDGVGPLHCLVAHGPGGFLVRDLDSPGGTFVNGARVSHAALRDGDVLTVGPFQMRAHLPRLAASGRAAAARHAAAGGDPDGARAKEALRIQVAAVAAQQAALGEEEGRLEERRANLEQQEAQLAAHLEEKHQKLVALHAQVQAARAALKRDRAAYERHVEKVTGDLSVAERDLLERRQQAEAERRRALSLQRRLKERYRRQTQDERAALRQRQRELDVLAQELEKAGERLHQEKAGLAQVCLRFNGEVELRRRQMQDGWDRLRAGEQAGREQRARDDAELDAWQADLERREAEVDEARQALHREREHWQGTRLGLEKEAAGLENRARNQRRKVLEQEQEIQRLEGVLRVLRRQVNPKEGAAAGAAGGTALIPAGPAPAPAAPAEAEGGSGRHLAVLEELAGELADQRLQLAEQWGELARAREAWQQEHRVTAAELKALAAGLQEKGLAFLAREKELDEADVAIRRRHGEAAQLRQHLVGWEARLRARELAWEAERDRLLTDLRGREGLAEHNLAALVELRQRWARRRRRELQAVQAERAACEKVRQQYVALRDERRRKSRELEEERSQLGARAVALEEYRKKCLSRAPDQAAAERRIDRLRRRWLAENAAAVRAVQREREALQLEATQIEAGHADLEQRADRFGKEHTTLAERQAGWEERQAQLEAEQARLRGEVEGLQAQRARSVQEAEALRNEVERIARQLLEEPEDPPARALGQAA